MRKLGRGAAIRGCESANLKKFPSKVKSANGRDRSAHVSAAHVIICPKFEIRVHEIQEKRRRPSVIFNELPPISQQSQD